MSYAKYLSQFLWNNFVFWSCLLWTGESLTASRDSPVVSNLWGNNCRTTIAKTPILLSTSSRSFLEARRRHSDDEFLEPDAHDEIGRQRETDRPTQAMFGVEGPSLSPPKPKIVVLGATGKVGRLVVRQLLEMTGTEMTIVAFCRDCDKAIRVLYDDMVVARAQKEGPKLQIIEGDLVPAEELPGFALEDTEDEHVWSQEASSAVEFLRTNTTDYDNRDFLPDIDEALATAIQDCTTIISCVGSVRPTNLWTDVLARPFWRLLRPDVSRWCADGRHPYYTHYTATRKALGFAEREQLRREAAVQALVDDDDSTGGPITVPKIRFIRISDLCVGHKPWHFVPLVTNAVQSVVVRYHEMAERLLENSMVETIILRSGDLVDDDRDVNTTSLQVSQTGTVPWPARVGRDDVAALAVAAAMFKTPEFKDSGSEKDEVAFHYTLACRWAGQDLDPYPSQGVKVEGAVDAKTALKRTLQVIERNGNRKKRRKDVLQRKHLQTTPLYSKTTSDLIVRMHSQLQRQRTRLRPWGVCVAIPIYILLGLFAKTLIHSLLRVIPGGKTIMLPALAQIQQWMLVTLSFVIGKLMTALPFLARRKQYISL